MVSDMELLSRFNGLARVIRIVPLIVVLAAAQAQAQDGKKQQDPVRLVMEDGPSLRFGQFLRVDFRGKIQADLRTLSPNFATKEGDFEMSRIRFGIKGQFLKHVNYEVEREFRDAVVGRPVKYPWRDVSVDIDYLDNFQFKIGKFKVPFSMEQLASSSELEFVNRSRIADDLAPARDTGAVLHGRFFKRGLGYEAGVFRSDGENSESSSGVRGSLTWATRVTATPLRVFSLPWSLDEAEFGAAVVSTKVADGLNSLRGNTIAGYDFFQHVPIKGPRVRIGAEANWRPGPFSLQSEFIYVSESREGQSVRAGNLPKKISQGWYVAGTWAITGESKKSGIEPRRPFLTRGIGAIELAVRYENISFGSTDRSGTPFRSPRASNLWRNSDAVWTAGINWYLNRWSRIQINGVRETIEDVTRSPIPGRERFLTGVARLQFSM